MLKSSSKFLVYLLTFLQIVLSFVLGVFGNKLAEVIKVQPQMLVFGTALTILALLIVTVLLINYQTGTTFSFPQFGVLTTGKLLTSRIATTFPFAVVLGLLMQFVLLAVFESGSRQFIDIPYLYSFSFHNYELLAAVVAVVTLFIFRGLRRDLILMVTYCIGLATGISGTLLMLRPYENHYLTTYFGWNTVLIVFGLIIRSERIKRYVESTLNSLTQER